MKIKKKCVAMLLAGGQGSRLYALTQKVAKPAIPYGGKNRFIDFPLSNCINSGIDTVGVLTQYQPMVLNEYIGNGQPWDLDKMHGGVHVLPPYQTAAGASWYEGTANAIYQNMAFIERYDPEYVIVLGGDHIYKMDYSKMLDYHIANQADSTIAVIDVPRSEASRFGIMTCDESGRIVDFTEKPKEPKSTLASMGIYVFTWEKLRKYLIENENANTGSKDFGKDIIPAMLENDERLFAYEFEGYWKDVGTLDSLWEANMDLLSPNVPLNLYDPDWKVYSRHNNMPPQYIGANAHVENSMITDDVKTMMFEAACFDGTNIRLSSKRIGLRTDASAKFEKGLDPNNAQAAIDRACQLMEELGAGEVVGGMVDVCSETREPSRVKFEPEKINKLLGTSLTKEEMIDYLGRVELAYDEKTDEIVAPTFRQDIHCNADVAEEVARFYGYDKIPMTLPTGEATTGKLPFKLRIQEVARDIAEYCGFSEGMSYSFESPKVFDKLCIPEDSDLRKVITISNPLGEDYSIMRTSTLNGMLASLSTNYNRRNKDVRLYELGNIYLPKSLPVTELPDERTMFTLGMYGKGDFFDMKGVCEEFFEKIGMKKKVTYDPNSGKPFLHPGRQANMIYEGKVVGYLGEVHPAVADNYSIGEKAYIAVIDILDVLEFAGFNHKYTGIAKYPAVTRDLSLVVPHAVLAGQIEEIFNQRGGNILESYQLFDIYEGAQIEKGFKSMAYSLVFRAHDKTLGENEISATMKKIMNGLNGLGIELRS